MIPRTVDASGDSVCVHQLIVVSQFVCIWLTPINARA